MDPVGESSNLRDQRLGEIEARLTRIENRLGIMRVVRREGPVHPPFPAPKDPTIIEEARPTAAGAAVVVQGSAPSPGARPGKLREPGLSLERLLGERVIAWVGALIVVAGVGLFVKLAYDQKWFSFPPEARCIIGAVFGAMLLAAGEILRRKVNPFAGAGSLAAGIGTLYASAFAAYELYDLIPLWLVFALLASVSAIGVVIALGSRLVSVGMVGFACAYLTPVLLWPDVPRRYLLPGYLLAVLVSSIVTARCGPGRFSLARWVGWSGTGLLGTAWIESVAGNGTAGPCLFLAVVWFVVQWDMMRTSGRTTVTNRGMPQSVVDAVSFVVTAWTSLLGLYVLSESFAAWDWTAPAVMAIACASAGALEGRVSGSLRMAAGTPRRGLSAGLFAQAGGLVLLATGVALSGPALILTWVFLGVASALAARMVRRRSLGVYGLVSMCLATVALLLYEPVSGDMMDGGRGFLGLVLTEWMWCMWLASGAWILGSKLMGWVDDEPVRPFARVGLAIGPALSFVSLLHEDARPDSLAWGWIVLGAAWACAGRLLGRRLAAWIALLGGLAACVPWLTAYGGDRWFVTAASPLMHEGLWLGLSVGGVLLVGARVASRGGTPRKEGRIDLTVACTAVAALVVLIATSYEAARVAGVISGDVHARAAAVSIWWGVFGTGAIGIGFGRRIAPVRHVGLGLLYIAGAKLVVVDFAHVAPAWRVGAFVGIGLLMLLVGVGYARLSRVLDRGVPKGVDSGDVPVV